jgi:hypothetical protein
MAIVDSVEPLLHGLHDPEGKFPDLDLKGHPQLLGDRLPPEGMGRVAALVNDHAVDATEHGHQSDVDLRHFLEARIDEVQFVVDLLFVNDPLADIQPLGEFELLEG